jgi:hypothetical protein
LSGDKITWVYSPHFILIHHLSRRFYQIPLKKEGFKKQARMGNEWGMLHPARNCIPFRIKYQLYNIEFIVGAKPKTEIHRRMPYSVFRSRH